MSVPPQKPLFLGVEAFELLVRKAPKEVLGATSFPDFGEAVGTSRERFEFIVNTLGADGRTQAMIGPETAGYLCNALGATILQLGPAEFKNRTEVDQEEALAIVQQLTAYIRSAEQAMGQPRQAEAAQP